MKFITLDIDWVIDEVLEDTLQLCADAGVSTTLFATHKTRVLERLDSSIFEVGIHPNFNKLLEGEPGHYRATIDALMEWFPDSKGVRSHSITCNGPILEYFTKVGLKYDVNQYYPRQLAAFEDYTGITRFTNTWGDYHQLSGGNPLSSLPYSPELPAIYVFHPIHIYLNTESLDRYEAAKQDFHSYAHLSKLRNHGKTPGIRDTFVQLLAHMRDTRNHSLLHNFISA